MACTNVCVMGVIIAKSECRQITSKFNGNEKGTISFTLRDSKRYFINCKVWGTEQFAKAYGTAFKHGDVIVVNRPRIVQKDSDVNRYNPQTTTPFQLTVNEGYSYIYRESIENQPHLASLISETIKSTSLALYLADVCDGGSQCEAVAKFFDLVVAVQAVKARTILTKNGEKTIREIHLMDTSMKAIKMTLWCRDDCERADKWQPLKTILHMVDVRCEYSAYEQMVVLQMARSTILIENPKQSSRVQALREYIAKIPMEVQTKWVTETSVKGEAIDLDTITEVMSVQKIEDLAKSSDCEFTAVLYAVITELDLDPTSRRRPVRRTCLHCNSYMPSNDEYCSNQLCVQKSVPGKNYVEKFNIRMNLSDHSGTLTKCHMTDKYAAIFLNSDLDEYLQLPETAFERIHWLHIFERRAIKLLVKRNANETPRVLVLEISAIDPASAAEKMKTY